MGTDPPRILLVEDEVALATVLSEALRFHGYECDVIGDGNEALARALRHTYDVLILDLMLPGKDGLEVLARLREAGRKVPTIVLTAKGADADRVRGLEIGADDYLSKDVSLAELMARVRAQLRRAKMDRGTGEAFEVDGAVFDLGRLQIARGDTVITLTPREGEIIAYLRAHAGNVVTREELLEDVWKYARTNVMTRTVDNTVAALRRKIGDDPDHPRLIVTIRGKGYRWGGGP